MNTIRHSYPGITIARHYRIILNLNKMNILKIVKGVNTASAVGGTVVTVYQTMHSVFKWYEKKHGKKKEQKPITRPIIRGNR